jgi:uncharacterized RDD family membrane protein YckC
MSIKKYPYTGRRILATVIDYTIVTGISILYIAKIGTQDGPGQYSITGFASFFPEIFWFAYIILAERYLDGTLGHQLCGLKVMSLDGNKLSFTQVFVRRIMDILEISWCFGTIAFILVRVDQHNQRLGDKVARTKVVGKSDSYADVKFDFEK